MSDKHLPERWYIFECGNEFLVDVGPGEFDLVLLNVGREYARRIVACFNACAGKPTELLELAAEFDAAHDDAEWEPPHPIFRMASDIDHLKNKIDKLVKGINDAKAKLSAVAICHPNGVRTLAEEALEIITNPLDGLTQPDHVPDATEMVSVPAAPAVPDGWKLVPVEPTEEMRDAALGEWSAANKVSMHASYLSYWSAMLAAAPKHEGCGACGDACAGRGECRLKSESPPIAPKPEASATTENGGAA